MRNGAQAGGHLSDNFNDATQSDEAPSSRAVETWWHRATLDFTSGSLG